MTVDLLGPKTLGDILRASYRAYVSQFRPFFLIALATVPLQMLAAVVTESVDAEETAGLITLPLQFASTLVFLIVTAALIHGANLVASGSPVDAGAALDDAFARFGHILTTQFLFVALVIVSILAFPYTAYRYWQDIQQNEPRGFLTAIGVVIGAIFYFAVRWNFTTQAVMLEGRRNWAALDYSAEIVRGQWWRTLGIVLVIALIVFPLSLVSAGAAYLPALPGAIIGSIALALSLPFLVIAQTLLYFDLKARKASHDIAVD